jgi:hypothetical protein
MDLTPGTYKDEIATPHSTRLTMTQTVEVCKGHVQTQSVRSDLRLG